MDGRRVQPAGDKIRKLRVERGWAVERLALKAGLSHKSVVNAENSCNILLSTLARLAEALGLEPKELLKSNSEPDQEQKFRVEIALNGSLAEFLRQPGVSTLVESLFKMLVANDAIRVLDMRSGSVIITMEMSEANAIRLLVIFPNFHEYAWEAIRSSPEGQEFFSGSSVEGSHSRNVPRLLAIADAVRELRVQAGGEEIAGNKEEPSPEPPPENSRPEVTPEETPLVESEQKPEETTPEPVAKERTYLGPEYDQLDIYYMISRRFQTEGDVYISRSDPTVRKTFEEALREVDPEGKWKEFLRTHYYKEREKDGDDDYGWYRLDEE